MVLLRRGEAAGDANGSTADIRAERPSRLDEHADGRERECHRQGAVQRVRGATAGRDAADDGSVVHEPAIQ